MLSYEQKKNYAYFKDNLAQRAALAAKIGPLI
jgi:hypothetical protein